MKALGLTPTSIPESFTPLPQAEIMWGCERGGSPHFPSDMDTIIARKRAHAPEPLQAFIQAVKQAEKRVWLMDNYFLAPDNKRKPDDRIQAVLEWFHAGLIASDIRILTSDHAEVTADFLDLFKEQERCINTIQVRRDTRCLIQLNTRLKHSPIEVHDRFAIVDNELWHFGATVGGFHASVNAASRGWSAEKSGAVRFFELVWDTCKGKR